MTHLISTKPRIVGCRQCGRVIWFAYDGGMPVYANTEPIDFHRELVSRIAGKRTYNYRRGFGIWYRNQWTITQDYPVLVEHEHSSGFVQIEAPCPIETNKKATDSNMPPF